jgi:hypothetical protein
MGLEGREISGPLGGVLGFVACAGSHPGRAQRTIRVATILFIIG